MNAKVDIAALATGLLCVAAASAAYPSVTSVDISSSGGVVTIEYELSSAPAIVTLDITTNGVSIGGANVQSFSPDSDVWKKVTSTSGKIVWYSANDWPGHAEPVNAVVTAWPADASPDYMVVDIAKSASPGTERYYQSKDFLPGGLLENPEYRTSSIVMRRIAAKDVTFSMGTTAEIGRIEDGRENVHSVTLTNDYYLGVFEVTQAQWLLLGGRDVASFKNGGYRAMRPVEGVRYAHIRSNDCTADVYFSKVLWPTKPYASSYIGKLRTLTGIAFDLPSEAQWEYAARAGHSEGHWGDGSLITSSTECPNLPGRYKRNGGYIDGTTAPTVASCDSSAGTATCGSYPPNSFGLYDMNGNVWELCLDYYQADLSGCNSSINIDQENPLNRADGTTGGSESSSGYQGNMCWRGGAWDYDALYSRAAFRGGQGMNIAMNNTGFRLYAPAGAALPSARASAGTALAGGMAGGTSPEGALDAREKSVFEALVELLDTFKAGMLLMLR